ncbi:unnamed protein product [Soboliphyme baturini]|uniref:Secreted protein n=1 Tax=Soboliphyme baturini TaxID=241478 RepID=A0A183IWQ7_9BILA|nr:unnamed protein product [Soboliphyme baturini]
MYDQTDCGCGRRLGSATLLALLAILAAVSPSVHTRRTVVTFFYIKSSDAALVFAADRTSVHSFAEFRPRSSLNTPRAWMCATNDHAYCTPAEDTCVTEGSPGSLGSTCHWMVQQTDVPPQLPHRCSFMA